ncbi:MAG: hypothetical protein ACYTF3_00600, partial [Planctomycetota bacterium]
KVSLAFIAAVKLLQRHEKHDEKKAIKRLTALKKQLEKTAKGDQQTAAALRLVTRHLDQMGEKKAAPKAPAKKGG